MRTLVLLFRALALTTNIWENAFDNIARGDQPMTLQEQMKLNAKYHFDNLAGAVKAGAQAAPFSLLTNALRVVR